MARKRLEQTQKYTMRLYVSDMEWLTENVTSMSPTEFVRTMLTYHVKHLKEKANAQPATRTDIDNILEKALGVDR